ncbi:hypothetical protein SNEBB_004744 [Seison nebaliae]|nr:hypothetical protein SNEBB_004744 [Seison nebaliae]
MMTETPSANEACLTQDEQNEAKSTNVLKRRLNEDEESGAESFIIRDETFSVNKISNKQKNNKQLKLEKEFIDEQTNAVKIKNDCQTSSDGQDKIETTSNSIENPSINSSRSSQYDNSISRNCDDKKLQGDQLTSSVNVEEDKERENMGSSRKRKKCDNDDDDDGSQFIISTTTDNSVSKEKKLCEELYEKKYKNRYKHLPIELRGAPIVHNWNEPNSHNYHQRNNNSYNNNNNYNNNRRYNQRRNYPHHRRRGGRN